MTESKITIHDLMTDKFPVDHRFPDIIQFRLINFNFEYPEISDSWSILKGIYREVLHLDPVWHFFFEGHDSILRFSIEFQDKVEELLGDLGVEYIVTGPWIDDQDCTARYQRIFTYLFHGFSELAMLTPDADTKEFFLVTDRVIHCFLNHQWYKIFKLREDLGEYSWEGRTLIDHGLARIEYNYEVLESSIEERKKWNRNQMQIKEDKNGQS